ncbi:uncharacterized protein LOC131012357 [Salvia miltiorrhiza]|uniref:uncharacterized protein LOC131012357 n=1 Tax=Salvia miltiorrhiza TaxID=226208 RepID=UPI0025ABEC1B|nr:uncharacterized protein LOC131012357 [Salvia miltiorrhiza]
MNTSLLQRPLLFQFPVNFCTDYDITMLKCNSFSKRSSFSCRCIKNEKKSESHQGFSVFTTDPHPQRDIGSIWSSMGFYVFSIHVPLSFGGLSAAAKLLHQPVLDPQTSAYLMLAIQTLEFSIVLLLLKYPSKPQYNLPDFFRANKSSKQRSWLLASVLGFGVLLSLVFITSYFTDRLIGPKDVNNPILKEIVTSGPSSATASVLAYCIVTPLLEEVIYRGFLMTSLASTMNWQLAVTISSVVFSASHFSSENFLQLLVVGFVLGCSYCWTGNLSASISIHSLYNALILYLTYIS